MACLALPIAAMFVLPPGSTITTNGSTSPNPTFLTWTRQDQLFLSAIVGSISPALIHFIATATTSRGLILAFKNKHHNLVKGTKYVTDFMQEIKSTINELALLGVQMNPEDLALRVLNGLDDSFKELSHAIQARADTAISFDKLHEKLLSKEEQLASRPAIPPGHPITVFLVASPYPHKSPSTQPSRSTTPAHPSTLELLAASTLY